MNDDFVSLFAYNRWADRRELGACRILTAEQYVAEPVPGWSSVRSSIVHIAVVTEGWLSGFEGESYQDVLTEAYLPTVDDAERLLDRANQIFVRLVPKLTPDWLATPRTSAASNKNPRCYVCPNGGGKHGRSSIVPIDCRVSFLVRPFHVHLSGHARVSAPTIEHPLCHSGSPVTRI